MCYVVIIAVVVSSFFQVPLGKDSSKSRCAKAACASIRTALHVCDRLA